MSGQEDLGRIQINNDVIATIASLAAAEVEGIAGIAGGSALAEVWGSKSLRKGIAVTTDEQNSEAVIDMEVNVSFGIDVYHAARQLQRAVRDSIESMTGLRVKAVNVRIVNITGEKPRPPQRSQADADAEAQEA